MSDIDDVLGDYALATGSPPSAANDARRTRLTAARAELAALRERDRAVDIVLANARAFIAACVTMPGRNQMLVQIDAALSGRGGEEGQ